MLFKGIHTRVVLDCLLFLGFQTASIIIDRPQFTLWIVSIILSLLVLVSRHAQPNNRLNDLLLTIMISLMEPSQQSIKQSIIILIQMKTMCRIQTKKKLDTFKNFVCLIILQASYNIHFFYVLEDVQLIVLFNLFYVLTFFSMLLIRKYIVPKTTAESSHIQWDDPLQQDQALQISPSAFNKSKMIELQSFKSETGLSKSFLKNIVANYPDAIMILDRNEQPVFCNNTSKTIFGIQTDKKSAQYLLNLVNCQEELSKHLAYTQLLRIVETKVAQINKKLSDRLSPGNHEKMPIFEDEVSISSSEEENDDELFYKHFKSDLKEKATVYEQYKHVLQALNQLIKDNLNFQGQVDKQPNFNLQIQMLCMKSKQDIQSSNSISMKQSLRNLESCNQISHRRQIFQVTIKPFIIEGQPYVLFITKDVTFLNKIEMLQKINENKSKMLSQVVHEFRNPLNCILLFCEQLQEHINSQLINKYLRPIESCSSQLLSLANDLLDVAQLKAGKFKLIYVDFDLKSLIYDVVDLMKVQIQSKNIKLHVDFEEGLNTSVTSDPNRIRQILINLIGNAIKFTQEGQIRVIVTHHPDKEDYIQLVVSDTGIGIDEHNKDKLFRAFGKLEQNKDLNPTGVGLGLLISNVLAKKLAQKDDEGSEEVQGLQVDSQKGRGSSFYFYLYNNQGKSLKGSKSKRSVRFSKFSTEAQVQKRQNDETSGVRSLNQYRMFSNFSINEFDQGEKNLPNQHVYEFKGILLRYYRKSPNMCACPQILIVDDTSINITALKMRINQQTRYRVDTAMSGSEALDKVRNFKGCQKCFNYKVIIMDVEMENMDGIETTRQIRLTYSKDVIMIVGCSGDSDSRTVSIALNAGMNDFLVKPVKISELVCILDKEISQSKA